MQVYFLVAEEHNYIKIGRTTQPRKRYAHHYSECLPCKVYMILIPNSPITELELLHKYAKNLYCQQEWFHESKELYQEIQYLYDFHNGTIISPLTYFGTGRQSIGVYIKRAEKAIRVKAIQDHFNNPNHINGHALKELSKRSGQ